MTTRLSRRATLSLPLMALAAPAVAQGDFGIVAVNRKGLVDIEIGQAVPDRIGGLVEQPVRGFVGQDHGIVGIEHQDRIGRCGDRAAHER